MSFYLTTPIYYVNSTPHIGHAYTTIIGDILVRHHRQRGERTFFLTGVDEHADKVARVATEQGLTPKEYADQIVGAWQELPERVNASIDFFIRTSDEGHKAFVQDFLQRIYDNGDVYQDVYAGLYCVGCEAFKTEAELVDGKCPDHGIEPEWLEEKNWFFRLSAYQDRLLQLYDERPDFVLPGFRANEARSFIAGGLRDFSISRATQTWGIPIPWDPDQVAYVWADALVNYLSALVVRARAPICALLARRGTCSRRTSSASTASTGRRCCSRPATSRPSSCSCTATSTSTTRRSRSRSGTCSTRSTSSTSTASIRSASGSHASSRSARTATSRWTASASATSASSRTTSATCSRGRRR